MQELKQRYIVVEGALGVGKTSLVDLLTKEFSARRILEQIDDNPFLHKFYTDRKTYAFQTQIYFLLSRFKQQQALFQHDLFSHVTIVDYMFEKDRIFAYVNLDEEELLLYEKLYSLLKPKVSKPDLVIFLQSSTDTIIERIEERDREFERDISYEYIDKLNKAYSNFFFSYKDSPLLVVNTDHLDFVKRKEDFKELVREIKDMQIGTKYYVPSMNA